MQFIGGKKKLVFDFVNPLEAEDPTHEVEGGGTLMMGQYWKRRMETVLAEYKSWRIYYKSHRPQSRTCHHANMPTQVLDDIDLASMISDADLFINAIMTDLGKTYLFSVTTTLPCCSFSHKSTEHGGGMDDSDQCRLHSARD